jgi:uncharacterized protein with NRDE domain
MCLCVFSYQTHPQYQLILATNRDEFYERPSAPANFWDDEPEIFAGRDLKEKGTWLGLSKKHKFAMVTNYRDLRNLKTNVLSRGRIVVDYLKSTYSPKEFVEKIADPNAEKYNGYNMLLWEQGQMFWYSNVNKMSLQISPGIYGLSNCILDTPWFKVEKSKSAFKDVIENKEIDINKLFKVLSDRELSPDDSLPDTGLDFDTEKMISSVFVNTPSYGTVCSTIVLIDYNGKITFIERTVSPLKLTIVISKEI